jgi:hypothetical protein
MRYSRMLRSAALLAIGTTSVALLAATAWGKPLLNERFHDEGTVLVNDFCDVDGLDVSIAFVVDGRVHVNAHGRDRLPYFLEHLTETAVITNVANAKSVTQVSRTLNQDMKVTDNGDGTLTILAKGTGNDVFYGSNGEVLARNPGQTRVEFLIDDGGTPTDPFDDEFLAFLGVVKESTGRTDDFCAAMETALS